MNHLTQTKKALSTLLIPVLLIHFSGCIASRTLVRPADIPLPGKYFYSVEGQKIKFRLDGINNSGRIISGKISHASEGYGKTIMIHILTDSLIQISPSGIISVPIEAIDKIEKTEYSTGRTLLLVLGGSLAIIIVIAVANFSLDLF